MSKKISIIRHGSLAGKFADYSQLRYPDFMQLLLKKIEPDIDTEQTRKAVKTIVCNSQLNKIICSTQQRGIQTASIVNEFLKVPILQNQLLNEVDFQEGILNIDEVNQGLETIRKKVLTNWYQSKYSEKFEDSINQWKKILQMVQKEPEENILLITHGWFMRIIQIYAQKKTFDNITLQELLMIKPVKNLGMITLNLE